MFPFRIPARIVVNQGDPLMGSYTELLLFGWRENPNSTENLHKGVSMCVKCGQRTIKNVRIN